MHHFPGSYHELKYDIMYQFHDIKGMCGNEINHLLSPLSVQWEVMGDVGSARYEPALFPPMPDHKGFKLQELSKIHPIHF